jgi:hypothetical protein
MKRSIRHDKQYIKHVKDRVKQKIINGEAMIKFVNNDPVKQDGRRLEGRQFSYAVSHVSTRKRSSKLSNRTMDNANGLHKVTPRKLPTSGLPRRKQFRPWSPLSGESPTDVGIDYFLSSEM